MSEARDPRPLTTSATSNADGETVRSVVEIDQPSGRTDTPSPWSEGRTPATFAPGSSTAPDDRLGDDLDALPVPCVLVNRAGVVLTANDAAGELLGGEARRRPFPRLIAAPMREAFRTFLWNVFASDARQTIELVLRAATRDASPLSVAIRGRRCVRPGGAAVGVLVLQELPADHLDLGVREAVARFEDLVGSVTDAMLLIDERRQILRANKAAETMFGYGAGELVGRTTDLLIPTRFRVAQRRCVDDLRRRVRSGTGPSLGTSVCVRRDGNEFPVDGSLVVAEIGRRSFATLIVRDVSSPEHAAELLRARLAAVIESVHSAIISFNRDGRIETWNPGAERLYGFPASEIVGQSMTRLVPPEYRREWLAMIERVGAGETIEPCATVRQNKANRLVRVLLSLSGLRDDAGRLAGFACTSHDITQQQLTEDSLREREQALHEFFRDSPLGLLWVEQDGRVLRANRAQGRILGRPEAELPGENIANWFADPEAAAHLLAELSSRHTLNNVRVRMRRQDGTQLHALVDANGLWRGDHLLYSRWFVRDITERVELERRILRVVEHEQRRFGNDLHDDLCQALAGVEFRCNAIAADPRSVTEAGAAKLRKLARLLHASIDHARALARSLVPVAGEDDGLMTALHELAANTARIYRLPCRFSCPRPVLVKDPSTGVHLYRIAQESINNAVRHSHATQLEIELLETGAGVRLSIRDNGIGIPEHLVRQSGLGLRIMRYRAGAINATIAIERGTPAGTTVTCHLPDASHPVTGNPE